MFLMNSKTILGLTMTVAFVASITGVAFATASWVGASGGDAEMKNKNTWILTVSALDDVPRKTTQLAGFAWLYDSFDPSDDQVDAFGITVHDADLNGDGKNDVRDSLQNKEGWHGHNFVLVAGAGAATLCVAEIADAPTSGIAINGNEVKVNVRDSVLADSLQDDTAVGYEIIVEPACGATVPTADVVNPEILDDLGLPDGLPLGIVLIS